MDEGSSFKVSVFFSKILKFFSAIALSSGVGKFSKSGGKTRGSFFCIKNSSEESLF